MGYHRAGFDIVGVDITPQPRYPFKFVHGDALEILRRDACMFDAVHASPPCQHSTAYKRRPGHVRDVANLIAPTRKALDWIGLPYVIENVEGARRFLRDPIRLCGSMFRLDVRRHRLFESSFPLDAPACDHAWQMPRFPPATNRTNLRSTVEVGVWRIPLATQRGAMGIDWMELNELSQAIPPAYTEWIGTHLLRALLKIKDVMHKWTPAPRGKDYKPHLDLELKLKRIARILRDLDRGGDS